MRRPRSFARPAAVALFGAGLALYACARPAPRAPVLPPDQQVPAPAAVAGEVTAAEARTLGETWRWVLAGDLRRAEQDYLKLLRKRPGLTAALTGLAHVRLRAGRLQEARAGFEAAIERRPLDLSALVGAAETAARSGDGEAALGFLRRAEAADPAAPYVRRRLAEVRIQLTEERMAAARAAAEAGDSEEAVAVYRRALADAPELSHLRLELADLLLSRGERLEAVTLLEGDPAQDREVALRLARLLEEANDPERALDVYRRLLGRDPGDQETRRLADELRHRLELARMPEEYRRIASAPTITRADLAALVAVKVTAISRAPEGPPPVAVDISGSWAREHILRVLAHDVMTVYPNHTFQPGAVARRGDLARAVQKVLDLAGHPSALPPPMTDMSRSHLYYYAASRVVAAGLMDLTPEGAFQAWRPPTGQEAIQVLEALVRLIGP